jgi:RHS repeat-associated protein
LTFNDQEKDIENGLYDLSDRGYDGKRGRFLKLDRLWEKFPSVSPYNYCNANPMRLTDPTGMQSVPKGHSNLVRWDVAGTFRGSSGTWQLVYNPTANLVVHLMFKPSK